MSELRFDGRVAVVTGAGRGMGRCHALLLAAKGAGVVVADIGGELDGRGSSPGPANEVVDEIKGNGGEAVACVANVADEAQAASIIDTAINTFGRLDILVNNAGISDPAPFEELTTEQFKRMIEVHYFGTLFTCKGAWPRFQAAGYGRIVNTTSEAIVAGIPDLTSYGAAKGAVYGLSTNLATEAVGTPIRVNMIAPRGNTRMAQADKARLASKLPGSLELVEKVMAEMKPELVSPAVAYLAHESCDLQGEILQVGAGTVARLAMVHAQGFNKPDITAEDIAANIDKIRDVTGAPVRDVNPIVPHN